MHEQQNQPAMNNDQELQFLMFNDTAMTQIDRVANLMANSKVTIPDHLKGNPGDCFAICMQAAQWHMNPFAVAQKTHIVNGTLGYEAQLVNAVINSMAPTRDRLHFEWFGDWSRVLGNFSIKTNEKNKQYRVPNWKPADEEGLGVNVWATLKGEDQPRQLSLMLTQARTRNSTLWADDPRQQLSYLAIKRWARLYCPDVILGVYTPDEMQDFSDLNEKEVHGYTETETSPTQAAFITQEQQLELISQARAAGKDEAYICEKGNVTRLADMRMERFEPAMNHLKKLQPAQNINGAEVINV